MRYNVPNNHREDIKILADINMFAVLQYAEMESIPCRKCDHCKQVTPFEDNECLICGNNEHYIVFYVSEGVMRERQFTSQVEANTFALEHNSEAIKLNTVKAGIKTFKQQLTEKPEVYTNEEDRLEGYYSEHLKRFCITFNAKLYTYKTWGGYVGKRNALTNKYRLIKY